MDGEVRRWIAARQVAEVNHPCQSTIADQQVPRMKIAVEPQWRSRPPRYRQRAIPHTEYGGSIDGTVKLVEMLLQRRGARVERHTSPRVTRGVYRRRLME